MVSFIVLVGDWQNLITSKGNCLITSFFRAKENSQTIKIYKLSNFIRITSNFFLKISNFSGFIIVYLVNMLKEMGFVLGFYRLFLVVIKITPLAPCTP